MPVYSGPSPITLPILSLKHHSLNSDPKGSSNWPDTVFISIALLFQWWITDVCWFSTDLGQLCWFKPWHLITCTRTERIHRDSIDTMWILRSCHRYALLWRDHTGQGLFYSACFRELCAADRWQAEHSPNPVGRGTLIKSHRWIHFRQNPILMKYHFQESVNLCEWKLLQGTITSGLLGAQQITRTLCRPRVFPPIIFWMGPNQSPFQIS